MKYILSILMLISFFGCSKEIKDNYQIVLIKSGAENSRAIDSMRYNVIFENDKGIYNYKSLENDTIYFFRFEKQIDDDSIIKSYDVECKLIGSQQFKFKNKEIIIYKYAYDIVEMADEEADYYFSNEYGLIMVESYAWLKTNILINEKEFKPLQDSIKKYSYKFKTSNAPPKMVEPKN